MHNTHSTFEQTNSFPNVMLSFEQNKSAQSTPQQQCYTSPLWALSYPSLPYVESQPATPNIYGYKNTKSIAVPSAMYDIENKQTQCDGVHMQLSGQHKHESQIICNILAKLLSLAIADIKTEIREQLLLSLLENEEFYRYLAQQQLLPSLFIALNDEYFGVREIALKLLGILATYNPAHIMPFIRKNLLELLTYLDNEENRDVNNRQQNAELIGDLIESASTETMKPYVNRIMVVLLRQLKLGDNIYVEISILKTIGKLAAVAQQSLIQYFNKFLPILVSILNKDMKCVLKKCVALQTLGKVIESTGLVIQPYLLYKKLLKIILDSLKADQHLTVRREAIQILGIIGALDPHIHKTNMKQIEMKEKLQKKLDKNKNKIKNIKISDNINEDEFWDEEESDFLSESNILLMTGSRDPSYYAYVALRSLILIVDNPSLNEYHREALSNIIRIFDNLGTECISYLQNVIPPILSNLNKFNNAAQRAMLLQQLARLINIVKSHIRIYLTAIFELIHNLWDFNAHSLVLLKTIKKDNKRHNNNNIKASTHAHIHKYHPYYNHPSSYMVPVVYDDDYNNYNYNLDHHRNRSDSFGPYISPAPIIKNNDNDQDNDMKEEALNTTPNSQNTDIKSQYELQDQLLLVMISICRAIQDEYQQYLHRLLPKLLLVLQSSNERSTISTLNALTIFGNTLQQFLFLVLPPIMQLIQSTDVSLLIRIKSIECIGRLCTKCDLNAYTSRIIHPLIHILNSYGHAVDVGLFNATMGTLCLMMIKMGHDFLIFASMITRTVNKCKMTHSQYNHLLHRLINHGTHCNNINKLSEKLFDDNKQRSSILSRQSSMDDHDIEIEEEEDKKELKMAEVMLSKAWDITGRAAERDWFAWLHGFQCELLSQNPRKELRVCSSLAQKYRGLATDLFNAAFLSCWVELNDKFQHECRRSLMSALQKTKLVPAKVKKILLCLVEFMERQNNSIWIDIPVLANVAELSHSYPNALYYKEREFRLSCLVLNSQHHHELNHHHHHANNNNDLYNGYQYNYKRYHHSNNIDVSRINAKFNTSYSMTAESLLRINNELQQNEAAEGILQYTQMHKAQINIKPTWFEKLSRWEEALDAYSKMHLECPPNDLNANITASLGRMRCLKALGEWQRLYKLATDSFSDIRLELDRLNNSSRLHRIINEENKNVDSNIEIVIDGYKSSKRQYRDSISIKRSKHQRVRSGFNAAIAKTIEREKNIRIKPNDAKKDTEATLIQFERDVAPLGAMACWNLGFWDKMKHFVKKINANNNFDGAFLRSIISVHENNSESALYWIEKCREFLDLKFTSIIVDDYENMYPLAVRAQQLVELEEILLYKDGELHGDINKCNSLQKMWKHRLNFVSHSVEVWQSILSVRQLVIKPKDDVDTWLKFTSLCRKSNRLSMSLKIIANLMGYPNEDILFYHQMYYDNENTESNFVKWAPSLRDMNDTLKFPLGIKQNTAIKYFHEYKEDCEDEYRSAQPNVAFAYAKHLWSAGLKNQALSQLSGLVEFMEDYLFYNNSSYYHHLTASCYLRLGQLKYESNDKDIDEVLDCYWSAIKHDPNSFHSWHAWALMNYAAIQHYEDAARCRRRKKRGKECSDNINDKLMKIIPAAVDALFQSITLSVLHTKLQDVLRLLYLLFRYGDLHDVSSSLQSGFEVISIDTWLSVIPQIIARLHIAKIKIRTLINVLLVKIALLHPQSLIFPLTVASQSPNLIRKRSAGALLDKIRLPHPSLVAEGEMISRELLRVAILWHEMWYEALIEASRLFWGKRRNIRAMISRLKPLYSLLRGDSTRRTLKEQGFCESYLKDLMDAWRLVEEYEKRKKENDMIRAWEYYRKVYNKIDHQFDKSSDLELQYVSPQLFNANNLQIIMPGTYNVSRRNIEIFKFNPSMTVFVGTAQRPRKLTILGSDGNNYTFLLKGREDLRQDERVMQLFGLINRLLKSNNETNKRDLEIRTYAVIPLAPNCGMIGWVSFTDTIHALIETYRESQQLIFGIEHAFVKEEFQDYDMLPQSNKLEIFKYVLNVTKGNDLRDLFWLKSWNSEIWLKKRCEYMRSLGVMSMVGYILGLGDRHPCNLMIHRYNGKVVHIDFGDCFEVAMLREKLPEKVPFRLTRMLINAMEISGFEGNFRINCQYVMHLLREHKESVMAVLEALAYDPLMNWRLLEQQEKEKKKEEKKENKKKKKNDLKLVDNTSSSSSSITSTSSSITTSPLTPLNSTTNHTPELELDNIGIANIEDIPKREMKKTKSVRFQDDNQLKPKQKQKQLKPKSKTKLPPQIHEIYAISLRAKKQRSFASSLQINDDDDAFYDDNNDNISTSGGSRKSTLPMSYSRRHRLSSLWMPRELDDTDSRDNVNKKALQVLQRVNMKLKGRDFHHNEHSNDEVSNVKEQVQRLFIEATNHENLSQAYLGWCPLW